MRYIMKNVIIDKTGNSIKGSLVMTIQKNYHNKLLPSKKNHFEMFSGFIY